MVPRNDNILIVGGFSEPDQEDLNVSLDDPLVKKMCRQSEEFLPGLRLDHGNLDTSYPIGVGLRPARRGGVRIERELKPPGVASSDKYSRIVHAYGYVLLRVIFAE